MPNSLKLSVLDQSPVRTGDTPAQALQETLQLAKACEQWGYSRFWVSEHHSMAGLAGSSPEILLAALGAATNTIRLGSGGVMLPHYSAHKVAENFGLLSALYGDRIDLGIGRAPGSDMPTAQALAYKGRPDFDQFPSQTERLLEILNDPAYQPAITTRSEQAVPVWMLGTSPDSAALAARLGLPYSFALFINTDVQAELFELYRSRFQPSPWLSEPQISLAVTVVCADTEQEAQYQARVRDVTFAKLMRGMNGNALKIITAEQAATFEFSAMEKMYFDAQRRHKAIGSPQQVKDQLNALAEKFGAHEIMAVTITHDFSDRLRSYELLAQAFELE